MMPTIIGHMCTSAYIHCAYSSMTLYGDLKTYPTEISAIGSNACLKGHERVSWLSIFKELCESCRKALLNISGWKAPLTKLETTQNSH